MPFDPYFAPPPKKQSSIRFSDQSVAHQLGSSDYTTNPLCQNPFPKDTLDALEWTKGLNEQRHKVVPHSEPRRYKLNGKWLQRPDFSDY